jgi:hypothetical protein
MRVGEGSICHGALATWRCATPTLALDIRTQDPSRHGLHIGLQRDFTMPSDQLTLYSIHGTFYMLPTEELD